MYRGWQGVEAETNGGLYRWYRERQVVQRVRQLVRQVEDETWREREREVLQLVRQVVEGDTGRVWDRW